MKNLNGPWDINPMNLSATYVERNARAEIDFAVTNGLVTDVY